MNDFTLLNCDDTSIDKYYAIHGMCVLVRRSISEFFQIIGGKTSKQVLWLKVKKDWLGIEFILGSVYMPSQSSVYFDKQHFHDLQNDIIDFDLPICLMGDWNARTARLADVFDYDDYVAKLHGLSDIDNDKELELFHNNNVSMVRNNQDSKNNKSGVLLCDICQSNNLCILNGRYGTDREGLFTCFNRNHGKSSIDYAVVSPVLFDHMSDFKVHEFDEFLSDTHCAISLVLKCVSNTPFPQVMEQTVVENINFIEESIVNQTCEQFTFQWKGSKPVDFINRARKNFPKVMFLEDYEPQSFLPK